MSRYTYTFLIPTSKKGSNLLQILFSTSGFLTIYPKNQFLSVYRDHACFFLPSTLLCACIKVYSTNLPCVAYIILNSSCLHYFAIANKTTIVTLYIHNFGWWEVYLQCKYLKGGLLGSHVNNTHFIFDITICPSQQFMRVSALPELPMENVFKLFIFCQTDRWQMMTQCNFNLHF